MNVVARKPADRHVMWKVKGRKRNRDYRIREHLTQDELDRLFTALKRNRHGHRDYMVALVTFLHGLRVSELIDLRWDDIDWRKGTMQIRRLKGSIDGVHYLEPDEAKGLKRLQREQQPRSRYIFTSERGEQFSRFAINKMIETAGRNADIVPGPSALLAAYYRHGAGQRRDGCLEAPEAYGARQHGEHDQVRRHEPGAIEGCVARQAMSLHRCLATRVIVRWPRVAILVEGYGHDR